MQSDVTITAASRLHFGLLAVPGAHAVEPERCFGGVGLMIEQPVVRLNVRPAAAWSATGPCADRALALAGRFMATLPPGLQEQTFAIRVDACPPEHVGLGVGTQLGLAVARALALYVGLEHEDAAALAKRVGRGLRSSLGIHGFAHGGFLVEGGKTPASQIAPLLARQPFPEDWRVLLVVPHDLQGVHGPQEREAFANVAGNADSLRRTEALCRLALLGMLPALVDHDLAAFSEALFDYNRKAGEWFQAWQGGIYSHPRVAELVKTIRAQGVPGVGQSSWGPTVFAVAEADRLAALREHLSLASVCRPGEMQLARPANRPAVSVSEPRP